MRTWLLAAGCLWMGAVAHAAETVVYRGQLDQAGEVVLELQRTAGEDYHGRYFYLRHGVDIPLSGKLSAFKEGDGNTANAPEWRGRLAGERFSGQWVDARRHRSLSFDLQRVAAYDDAANAPSPMPFGMAVSSYGDQALSPYEQLKMQLPMKQGPEVVVGDVAYREVTDPRSGIAYPRLSRHPDARLMAQINRLFTQRHAALIENTLDCRAQSWGDAPDQSKGDAEERVRVSYFSPTLISVVESGDAYCGGAHPDSHWDPYTLDLRHGGYLDFDRLFDFTASAADGGPSQALRAFIQVHLNDPALRVKNPNVDNPDDCIGSDSNWPIMYFVAYFDTPDRLVLGLSGLPHASMACAGDVLRIPFDRLKPLELPGAAVYLAPGA